MVNLSIDGKSVTVPRGTTILDAAAQLNIRIPTLCWLQKVSPTGACRLCAVEIEGVDRPMTACNTPVKEGISVTTQSERIAAIRRKVLELLLVNHPLDCPVCDAGGECGLQDACYDLGAVKQEYSALLERYPIRYDWSLLESDPNRCILCEKCVKVDHEVVGADAITVTNRGEAAIIDTVDGGPLNCEFCGNCIDACPTGTLIAKPSKFRGRPWAFKVTRSVCPFCSVGCEIDYHSLNGRVERVTGDDSAFNKGNLCINGRFGYSYLNSTERLTTPFVKDADGRQAAVEWDLAMTEAADKLLTIVRKYGADAVAGIGSPRVTNEESFLFQKLLRVAIGTNNIDSEARFGYAQAQKALRTHLGLTGASNTIDRIEQAAAILVIGSDLNAEATGVEYRVIKAATKHDAKLVLANMRGVKLKKYANCHLQYRPHGEIPLLHGLMKVILEEGLEDREFIDGRVADLDGLKKSLAGLSLAKLATDAGIEEATLVEAARLIGGKRSCAILFGEDVIRSAQAAETITAIVNLALLTGSLDKEAGGLFPIGGKNNTQGLLDMGVAPASLPGRPDFASAAPGRDLWQIIEGIEQGDIKALYLIGSDPLTSFPDNGRVRAAFEKLEFLLVQDIFATNTARLAHVVLPAAAAAEKNGSFTTTDNRVHQLGKAIEPPGDARNDMDILTELYSRLGGTTSNSSITDTVADIYSSATDGSEGKGKEPLTFSTSTFSFQPVTSPDNPTELSPLHLMVGPTLFHNGTISTRSANNLTVAGAGRIEIAEADAARLGIGDGATVRLTSTTAGVTGTVKVSDRLQPGMLFAPNHFRDLNVNALLTGNANLVGVKVEKA
jgi:formate dehydrogenase alpha subunit